MAATTITELQAMPCSRCAGSCRISQFQHRSGGECFRCGATGVDPVMKAVERDMTDEEVISTLAKFGFDVMFAEREAGYASEDDYLALFLTDEEVAERAQAMQGARMMLEAL
jgi:hypothetical protein